MSNSSKTEKPSPRRLEKAREEGQFLSSREMVAAFQFLVFFLIAVLEFPGWLRGMRETLRASLTSAFHSSVDLASLPTLGQDLLRRAFVPVAVIGGLTTVASLSAHLMITRLGFSFQKMVPDFKRFSPLNKVKNMARQGGPAVLQASLMLVLFAAAITSVAKQNAELFFALPFTSLDVGLAKVGASLKDILWKAAGLFLLFGFIDLFRQRQHFMKDLRMTKQELKEENKESQGNPLVKGKIRRLQRDFARRRMMKEVGTATAVIVNPTHFAVALRYDHASMATPVVVAKGKNYLALRIKQRALDNGVPLVEDPPLAQALYRSVDVGKEIPLHLYRAVAEVLGYIYRLTRSTVHAQRF
jgi:flagellar biosynthetic protein FlhB